MDLLEFKASLVKASSRKTKATQRNSDSKHRNKTKQNTVTLAEHGGTPLIPHLEAEL